MSYDNSNNNGDHMQRTSFKLTTESAAGRNLSDSRNLSVTQRDSQ